MCITKAKIAIITATIQFMHLILVLQSLAGKIRSARSVRALGINYKQE